MRAAAVRRRATEAADEAAIDAAAPPKIDTESGIRVHSLAGLLLSTLAIQASGELPWTGDVRQALEDAKRDGRPVVVYLRASW